MGTASERTRCRWIDRRGTVIYLLRGRADRCKLRLAELDEGIMRLEEQEFAHYCLART
jgi:hypothetical protein